MATLQTFGPAAWRSRLGPTTFGSVLATSEAEAMWRPYLDAADADLRQLRGSAEAFARERQRLLDYSGAITGTVWLEHAEDGLEPARWSMTITAEPDGHTDLQALANESADWLARLLDVDDKGRHWRDLELIPPQVRDGRLVLVQASPEDADAALTRAMARRLPPLPPPTTLRLEVAVPSALGMARDRPSNRDWYRVLLGPATQRITFAVGTAGPQLAFDLGVEFGEGARGLLGALLPLVAGVPDLEWLLPEGTAAHTQSHLDFAALCMAAIAAEAQWEDREVGPVRARVARDLGLDVAQDLAPHLGDAVLLTWKASEPQSKDHSLLGNLCVVVPLRDEAKAIAGLRTLLAALGWSTKDEPDDVLSAWNDRMLFLPSLWLRAGHGVACLAVGDEGPGQVVAVLRRAAEAWPRAAERPVPPTAPAGWNGAGAIDVTVLLGRYVASARVLFRDWLGASSHLPRPDVVARETQRWLPLLQKNRLAVARTMSGTTKNAWRGRLLW